MKFKELFEKIKAWIQFIDQVAIFKIFKWTGWLITEILFVEKYKNISIIPLEEDKEDLHTIRHFSLGVLLTILFFFIFHLPMGISFLISFLLLLIYEIALDGYKLVDKRGYQISDVGADFWGAILPYLIYLIGK